MNFQNSWSPIFFNMYYKFFSFNIFYSFVTHTREKRDKQRQTHRSTYTCIYSILNEVSFCEKILRICFSETKYAYQ